MRFVVAIALSLRPTRCCSRLPEARLPLWPAQVTTTVLMTFVNYLVYRLWVFR